MLKKTFAFITAVCLVLSMPARADRFANNDSNFYFAAQFLKTAFEQSQDNFVVSPLSVYAATALLANGAAGNSLAELGNILTAPYQQSELNMADINATLSEYIKNKQESIKITNTIAGEVFRPEYIDKVQKELFAQLDPSQAEPNKLKLINEVNFKDTWSRPFDASDTHVHAFHSLDGTTDQVDMMYDHRYNTEYYQDDKMQAVCLPYINGNFMHIFLPKEGVDFAEFVRQLRPEDLHLNYERSEVKLSLPRFEINYDETEINSFFKKWGIQEVFIPSIANLTPISDVPHYVESITHEAKIKVNEEGTEAFAKTVIHMMATSMRGPRVDKSIKFIADRPFVFMLNDGDFIGVYTKGKRVDIEEPEPPAPPYQDIINDTDQPDVPEYDDVDDADEEDEEDINDVPQEWEEEWKN